MSGNTWQPGQQGPGSTPPSSSPQPQPQGPGFTPPESAQPPPHGPGFTPPSGPPQPPGQHGPGFTPPPGSPWQQGQVPWGQPVQHHGYAQGWSPYGLQPEGPQEPDRPNRTPYYVVIGILVLAIVGVGAWLLAGGGRGQDVVEQTPTPGPSDIVVEPIETQPQTPPTEPGEPTPVEPQPPLDTKPRTEPPPVDPQPTVEPQPTDETVDPTTPAPPSDRPPVMPFRVGNYEAMVQPDPELGFYLSADQSHTMIAVHYAGITAQDQASVYEGVQQQGVWWCAPDPALGDFMCMADAYGGLVMIGNMADGAALVIWGDEFLRLWV